VRQRSQTLACRIKQGPQEAGTGELELPPKLLLRPALRFRYGWKGQKESPIGEIRTGPDGGYPAEDLLTGARYLWRGEWNYVRLTPEHPAHVLSLSSVPTDGTGV